VQTLKNINPTGKSKVQAVGAIMGGVSGYSKFMATGTQFKQNNGRREVGLYRVPTSVNRQSLYIEGKAIEGKEGNEKESWDKISMQNLRIVDNTRYIVNGQLVLPIEVVELVDNPMYLNRHKKLARDYGVKYLLKLAELAQTKAKPSRWYAKVTSVKQWSDMTENMLINLFKKLGQMKEKLAGIGVDPKWLPYFVGANTKLKGYNFDKCVNYAMSRGVKKRPNMLAKAIKNNIDELPLIKPKLQSVATV